MIRVGMATESLSILIADDNEINRWLLIEQLQFWTDNITEARDGKQAWEYLSQQSFSLALIDVNMPVMNGLELVKRIRASTVHDSMPVVAITAHAHAGQVQALLAEGFSDCLVKPVLLADLRRIVSQWCSAAGNDSIEYYAQIVLEKTGQNRSLGQVLIKRLFEEMPGQFDLIEQAMQNRQYRQAWEIAHKLHGAFCFYGFADFRQLAQQLEQCLWEVEIISARQHFRSLREKFNHLLDDRSELLKRFAD